MTDRTSPTPSHTSEKTELPFYFSPPPGYETVLFEYPAPEDFMAIVNDYLQNLSSKKRDKALVDGTRYKLILQVLKDPRNTAISTAQFRFWVKKMFKLVTFDFADFVCHDGKPVAIREDIYNILVVCHKEAHHGGRDKTSALVRKRYSWIPKELIARFVRHCPFCISRRNGCQSSLKNTFQYIPSERNWNYFNSITMAANVATSAAAVAVASSQFSNTCTDENSFEFYYSKPKDCCQENSPKPNSVYHPYMSFSTNRSTPPPTNFTNNSAPSAAAAAVAVAAAAIAAVNLNQTPSSPSCSVSSTDSCEQKTPFSLVSSNYLTNDKSIDETMDTPYITSC